ncbi:putative development/cell death domain-containing protein [Medicago truncatula]|uniref:Putative development/cell death domain-containing protein n=1 Tax=Medicago truncatula TaxID=3880 RepID=A0A396JDH7_MEDTR|nr:putative development/cell death domain-containing protein [Medicago truncatula]
MCAKGLVSCGVNMNDEQEVLVSRGWVQVRYWWWLFCLSVKDDGGGDCEGLRRRVVDYGVNENVEGELLPSRGRVLVSFWLWFGFSMKGDGGGLRTKMDAGDLCKNKESGIFPEHGAIFMSNRSTLKECFERSLFGLPGSFSDFVKNVKAGMILFLFEFEERKLHGVFEAITDGGMNISPHAYVSSGQQFPAQVKFTRILRCDPLFENEFCDAIRDNYFTKYKFNFGLSEDQVQSLMWLFNSRKREVPRSLHQKKRKTRKWDFQIIEDVLKKGRVTNPLKRKLNVNHGTPVTAEQEVEKLFLSPESFGKGESMHLDVDAYDPENPGFNQSVTSGANSAASYESHELPTLLKKKENLHIFEDDNEDFIPLCSTDHSDLEDGELGNSSEGSDEEQIELDMLIGIDDSSIPVPRFLLSDKESDKLGDSSSAAVSDFQSKDESDNLNSLPSKGMYCDEPKEKTSVFSRLNFSSKGVASKNQNDANGKDLVNNMSRENKQYQYESIKDVRQQSKNGAMYKRASVFLRLAGASDAVSPQVPSRTGLYERTGGWKKVW